VLRALTIVAEGGHPDMAKPLKGFGSGILELALRFRGDAYRVVYAVQLGDDVWIIHAFQKKSKAGIKTPRQEIDLVRERLTRLKEMLK
jgi:phage-related protein